MPLPSRRDRRSPTRIHRRLPVAGSPWLSMRLGYALQHGVAGLGIVGAGDVAQGHHTDQAFLTVEHRQTTYLDIRHVLRHVLHVLVFEAVADITGHDLAHRRVTA